jgi:cellulose synthase/poly-beta-1,6-N-acetylglucosamine synthase-like glycosyltransferase
MAEGEYVAFCDNDDLFARDCFSKLVSALEELNADMAFCGHDLIDVNDKTVRKYDEKFVYPKKNPGSGEEVLTQYLLGKISIWGGAVLYRRAYLLENGIFYTQNCYCAENNEVFVKALDLARRVACVRQSLFLAKTLFFCQLFVRTCLKLTATSMSWLFICAAGLF